MKSYRVMLAIIVLIVVSIGIEYSYLFVHSKETQVASDELLLSCDSSASPVQCWSDAIDLMLEEKGVDVAFEAVAKLYDAKPQFAQSCHSFTHRIGQTAYTKFANHEEFAVVPKTAYCGYGFYHGFMEALLDHSRNFEEARKFCAYVDQKLSAITPDAELQCFHGIGHGTVNDHDPRNRGNEQALTVPALVLCEKVSETMLQLYRCASGVFNGLANFYMGDEYGLVIKKDDPLWICREQKKEYQEACYGNMNVALMWLTKHNFAAAASFVERIKEDEQAVKAIRYLAAPYGAGNQDNADFKKPINDCRSLQSRLQLSCLQGFAFGMLEHGPPGSEYIKPLEFCDERILTEPEKKSCFNYIFSYLAIWYPQEKAEHICSTAIRSRAKFCIDDIRKTLEERSR